MPLVYERQRPRAMKAENIRSLKQLHEYEHEQQHQQEHHQTPTIERWGQQDVIDEQVYETIVRCPNVESGSIRSRAELIEKLKLEAAAATNVLEQNVRHPAQV